MIIKKKKKTKKTKKPALKVIRRKIGTKKTRKISKKINEKINDEIIVEKNVITPEILLDSKFDDELKKVYPESLNPLDIDLKKQHSQPKITITNTNEEQENKKSPHIVNLKNPHQDIFLDDPFHNIQTLKPKPPINTMVRPPRSMPRGVKKTRVDFVSSRRLLDNFGLIDLFKLIAFPFSALFKKMTTPSLKYKNESSKNKKVDNQIDTAKEMVDDIFSAPKSYNLLLLNIPHDWHKKIAIFLVISIILIVPLQAFTYYQNLQSTKDRILLMTNEAIESLRAGQYSVINLNLDEADLEFDQAKASFSLAQNEINNLSTLTTEILKILPGQSKSVEAGLTLLEVGEIVAETGQILINSGQLFLAGKSISDYYHSLVAFEANLKVAIEKFNEAKEKIEQINPADLPLQHRETFSKVLTYLPTIKKGLIDLYSINSSLLKILGDKQWQRYMLVFLNNNELRGGGGFMGTFGIIDIDRGEIKNLEIPGGGTYSIQGQLKPKVISPEPLWLINPRWEFQDANWWPDFPTSARKMQWFYENAGGPSVDGVIALTATMMERLLDIFGPISMPEYSREINSSNFVEETQKIVELEYDKEENRPKQFLADLAPKLLERIFAAKDGEIEKLFKVINDSLNEKHLLVSFDDELIKDVISDFGWSGELKRTDGDYLSVVHTNLAGGKTDGVIKEIIDHQAEVQTDGSIINTVKLTRRHTGIAGENIFTGVQNNSYVRFYVPLGSTLIEASGFKKPADDLFETPSPDLEPDLDLISIETDRLKDESTGTNIYKENGKTVFGNWLQLKPGEVGEAIIKYRLPFKLSLEGQNTFYYSLLIQKQSGSIGSQFRSYLKLNNELKPFAKFPADIPGDNQGVSFSAPLTTDQFYGVVLVSK